MRASGIVLFAVVASCGGQAARDGGGAKAGDYAAADATADSGGAIDTDASAVEPSDASALDGLASDDERGPCPPGQHFCPSGCQVIYPGCFTGPCPPPPGCAPFDPGLACPNASQRLCAPCLNVPSTCVDPGDCLPAQSCPAGDAGPACVQGQEPCYVDCLDDYVCVDIGSAASACAPVCPPGSACWDGVCTPMR